MGNWMHNHRAWIEPRRLGRRELEPEPRVLREPSLHRRMRVRRGSIEHHVQLGLRCSSSPLPRTTWCDPALDLGRATPWGRTRPAWLVGHPRPAAGPQSAGEAVPLGSVRGECSSVNTRAMNASNSSDDTKWIACPDSTCSTRPARRPSATSASACTCTRKARCVGRGWIVSAGRSKCTPRHAIESVAGVGSTIRRDGETSPQVRLRFLSGVSQVSLQEPCRQGEPRPASLEA